MDSETEEVTSPEAAKYVTPKEEPTDSSDPDHGELTSEVFQIEVHGLPGFGGMWKFKNFLLKQFNLETYKVKTPGRRDFAYISFRTQADQEKAIDCINGYVWKRRTLTASVYKPVSSFKVKMEVIDDSNSAQAAKDIHDTPVKRRQGEELTESSEAKRSKNSTDATCPLFSIPYADQLKQKKADMEQALEDFGKKLNKVNPDAKRLLRTASGNLPCKFLGIRASPKTLNYRNSSEFTIGKNSLGEIVVGCRVGSYVRGSVEVGSIEHLPQYPERMKKAAKVFEKYAAQSKFQIYQTGNHSGHFRQLTIRTSEASDEVMIIVGVYSPNCAKAELVELKAELKAFFETYDRIEFDCTSLYFQDLRRRHMGQVSIPVEHLYGKTHIYDMIHGLKFRIGPLAFFQVNTSAADILFRETIELAAPKPHSTVLDICCGTGAVGLCFARRCKQVLGVEIAPDAVKDAEFNAAENGIENCKFIAGNAKNHILSMVKEAVEGTSNKDELDIIAVVDPPRIGLNARSIHELREAKGLNRLVYFSGKPLISQRDWLDLGMHESKTYKGQPFLPTMAVAVDMCPHTAHSKLIILFERVVVEKNDDQKVKDEPDDDKNGRDIEESDPNSTDSLEEDNKNGSDEDESSMVIDG